MKKILRLFALALVLLPLSCNKEREEPDSRTLEYSLNVTNDNYTATTVLDGIGDTRISEVLNLPPWVGDITREEALLDGSMVLNVPVKADPTLDGVRTAQLQIKMSSGATAILSVNQRSGLPTGLNDGKSPSVNTELEGEEWWKAQTVQLITKYEMVNGRENCTYRETPLPWNTTSTGVHNNLPQGEMDNMLKHSGDWILAFNTTGIKSAACVHQNYFGMYNKTTGVMRVFYFWPAELLPPSGANDHLWYVRFQDSQAQHNATQFAVPLNHKLDMTGPSGAQFEERAGLYHTTAYSEKMGQNLVIVPEQGWWAFDVDLSAMRGKSFFDDYKPITIGLHLFDTQNVMLHSVLKGDIKGDLKGSMNLNALKPASANDGGKITSSIASGASGFLTNKFFLEQITGNAANHATWGWVSLAAGCAVNIAGNLGKEYGKSGGPTPGDIAKLGELNATLSLGLNATMTTQGLIKSQRSHAVPEVTLPKEYFRLDDIPSPTKAGGTAGQMGRGLWNISEDPVVYIVKDAFWANKPQFTYYSRTDLDWYRQGQKVAEYDISMSPHQLGMRLISFFDPTSIGEIVINEDLFGHPQECRLGVSYGIYPGSQAGYTDWFREATSLQYNPITLSTAAKDQKVTTGNVPGAAKAPFRVFKMPYNKDFFKVKYENPYPETMGTRLSEQDVTGSKTEKKASSAFTYERRYYGSSLFFCNPEANTATVDEVQYVADPQIFLPFDEDRRVITDPDIPDMVVSVQIVFKSQGPDETEPTWKTYTLRYLPRIEFISASQVKDIANRVKTTNNGGQPSFVSYETFANHNDIIQAFSTEISAQLSK